ncbi:MAG: peptidase [Calditrichaeota bacterium]|nr:MAG: peptidase [Calditrichota bacterium]
MRLLSIKFLITIVLTGVIGVGCKKMEPVINDYRDIQEVEKQLEKFVPVEISADLSQLQPGDRKALKKLVEAAKIMDEIFLRQVYHKNVAIRTELKSGSNKDYGVLLKYFTIMFGPFDRLEGDAPFINLQETKPAGANFYPPDLSKEEFNEWLKNHPEDDSLFTSNFTIIERHGKELKAVPYSQAYRVFLEEAAMFLREAADFTENPSLKKYLNSRAEAFLSNDYFQSDMDWMDLHDHDLEVVIGPYEVYEDKLFGYKAAFTAFITLVDKGDSEKLRLLANYLNDLERRLPIPDEYKNFERGSSSPIMVVNELYTGGDTKAGVQTAAFNLPNDERVREAKGSKKVMLKNVIQAKYEKIAIPIMQRVLSEKDLAKTSADAFFYHILLHEMVHGIGPGKIVKNGKETTVNKELKETYSTLEEAKADVVGLYQFPYLIEKGVFDKELADKIYASFVGGIFRSVRFGIEEAHGGANVITLNYLMEKGGVDYDASSGRFVVNDNKIAEAVKSLSHDILMIQAHGDYEAAKAFIQKYRYISPELEQALARLSDVPVDIWPMYGVEN